MDRLELEKIVNSLESNSKIKLTKQDKKEIENLLDFKERYLRWLVSEERGDIIKWLATWQSLK